MLGATCYSKSMSLEIIHSLILILTILAAFLFSKSYLATYDLQFSAILFIIFFLSRRYIIPRESKSRLLESVVFSLIIVSIVVTSGGVNSPLFFLIYFLLFSLSLLLEPVISITATLTLIVCFLLTLPENQSLSTLLPIFSLAFLTPFALVMGQAYTKSQKMEQDTYLFLSLILKNHLKEIRTYLENFMGDHELHAIKRHTSEMERVIEKFEKKTP